MMTAAMEAISMEVECVKATVVSCASDPVMLGAGKSTTRVMAG